MVTPYPYIILHTEAVGLVLVLLDFSCDLCHFPSLAEVDQLFTVSLKEVRITLLCFQDVCQINPWDQKKRDDI